MICDTDLIICVCVFWTAAESGLPLLNPYEDGKANFSHGANFAVAGATALSAEFLAKSYVLHK